MLSTLVLLSGIGLLTSLFTTATLMRFFYNGLWHRRMAYFTIGLALCHAGLALYLRLVIYAF